MKALLHTFRKERREALCSFNEAKITAYAKKYGAQIPQKTDPDYDRAFWVGVAKAVLALGDIPATTEQRARDILKLYNVAQPFDYEKWKREVKQ